MNLRLEAFLCCSLLFTVSNVLPADAYLSYNALETHFYKPDKIKTLQNVTTEEMLDYLIGSGLDRWARFHKKGALSSLTSIYERTGFGLRLLKYPDRYYLLPEIGGPNERPYYEIYEVLEKPEYGDWQLALTNNTLELASRFAGTSFEFGEFVSSGMRLDDTYLRVDDFTNTGFESDLANYSVDLPGTTIVDLRFNGGGRINYARKMLNLLITDNIYMGYQTKQGETTYFGDPTADSVQNTPLKNMNVLVSRHTASAAEWLAKNLQYLGARVIGERTAGKCVLHSVFPVGNREYFDLAIGEVRPASEKIYSHCQYGIIPDVYLQERALVETEAKTLVKNVEKCQSENRLNQITSGCMGIGVRTPVSVTSTEVVESTEGRLMEETPEKKSGKISDDESTSELGLANGYSDHKSDSQPSIEGAEASQTKVWVEKICIESEWQILLASYLSRADADALIKRIDADHRPLIIDVAKNGREYHQVYIRSISGELNAQALSKRLDIQLGVTSTISRSERSEAYARHLKAVAPEEAFTLINDPIAGTCLQGKFTEEEADELISRLDELADIKFNRTSSR